MKATDWQKWWCWFPVGTESGIRWFSWIERRHTGSLASNFPSIGACPADLKGYWVYRDIRP